MGSYNIVIPLRTENDMWSFLLPFDFEIWILALISVPIFIVAMSSLDYLASGQINWDALVGFILRNVLSENIITMPDKKFHQKILVFVWLWACFILVMSYAGNLTAMITRPKFNMEFTKLEDFINQDEITLVTEEGTPITEAMRQAPKNSTFKRIIERTQILDADDDWSSNCFTTRTQSTLRHASICDHHSILTLLSEDFSESGKCNWYTLKSNFCDMPGVMAFQVCWPLMFLKFNFEIIFFFRDRVLIWMMQMSSLISLENQA